MNKWIVLGVAATFGAANVVMRTLAANPPVDLQAASPGVAQTGNLNVSGTATVGVLKSQGTVFGQSTAPTGFAYGGFFTVASNQGRGFYGYASSPTGLTYGGFFQNASSTGRAVYGLATATSSANYGGYFQSAGTSGRGVLGVATAGSGLTFGGYFKATSFEGSGVYGEGAATGGTFKATNPTGRGVYGEASSTSASTSYGGYFRSYGTQGNGVLGWASAATGQTNGGQFQSASSSGAGVLGWATAGTGATFGGKFLSNSTSGRAVEGWALAGSGATYGVMGINSSVDPAAFGLFATGRSGASGTKSFRIDHPFDPENKYLLHYSAEGPEPLNLYSGTTKTDKSGYATIRLPDYFGEINRDPRIQLTVDDNSDDFVMVKVVGGVQSDQFRIRTNKGEVKVYWEVKAVRYDLWVRKHGALAEIDKQGSEKGTYQHPELYGKPEEMGMSYRPEDENDRAQPPAEPSTKSRLRR